MPQTIALQVQNPQIDVPGAMLNAQRFQAGQQTMAANDVTNTLNAAKATDEEAQLGALANYRQAAGAGDPKALDQLKAYPEVQAKIHAALGSMTPKQVNAVGDKVSAWHDAVIAIQGARPDQRDQVANDQIDQLQKDGHLSATEAKTAKDALANVQNDPTAWDNIVQQVIGVHDALSTFKAGKAGKPAGAAGLTSAEKSSLYEKAVGAVLGTTHTGSMNADQQKLVDAAYQHMLGLIQNDGYSTAQAVGAAKSNFGGPGQTPALGGSPGQSPALVKNSDRIGAPAGASPPPTNATGVVVPKGAYNGTAGGVPQSAGLALSPSPAAPSQLAIDHGTGAAAPLAPGETATPKAPAATPSPKGVGSLPKGIAGGDGRSQASPYTFASGDEASIRAAAAALPSGTWFTNPATGKPLQKK